jgi:hypothetical protein
MTSSIDAWKERYSLEQVRLPGDIDELEVICCESDTRTVSHIGIELENCIFNNSTLQQLRQRVAPGGQTKVQLRYNPARMDRIWVQDPVTLQRFEVMNHDPETKDLSAKQVSALESIRRKSQSTGTVITRAQARKRIEEIYRPLVHAKTMLERRRALKILGLVFNESPPEKSKKMAPKKRPKVVNTSNDLPTAVQETNGVIQATGISVTPLTSSPGASPPKFKVVRKGLERDKSTVSTERNSDANPH